MALRQSAALSHNPPLEAFLVEYPLPYPEEQMPPGDEWWLPYVHMAGEWWTDHGEVVCMLEWMADAGYTAHEIVDAADKPWHFTAEYITAVADRMAEQ